MGIKIKCGPITRLDESRTRAGAVLRAWFMMRRQRAVARVEWEGEEIAIYCGASLRSVQALMAGGD